MKVAVIAILEEVMDIGSHTSELFPHSLPFQIRP